MTELDRDGNPRLQAGKTRDRPKGRSSVARPYAAPRSVVSIANRGEGFEALMAEQHANPRLTPSRSPSPNRGSARLPAARYGGQRRVRGRMAHPRNSDAVVPVLHSAPHILLDCPLVSIFRSHILKDFSFHYLFWTVKGAEALATFLVRSNSLLCPLPPCPDPP